MLCEPRSETLSIKQILIPCINIVQSATLVRIGVTLVDCIVSDLGQNQCYSGRQYTSRP